MSLGRVLVTGGAGFIGSHVVESLVSLGCQVRVLDNMAAGKHSNLAGVIGDIELFQADIRDSNALRHAAHGCETIVHLAAQPSVPVSIADPIGTHQVNYEGTLRVMEVAKECGVPRVVFASSAAVYAPESCPPSREDEPPCPVSPYGVDKLSGEYLLRAYSRLCGIQTRSLRFFNVYGERQDPSSPYSGVISIFLDRIQRELPLTLFGDGSQTRDFVYVRDVAQVVAELAFDGRPTPDVMNVGTGIATTLTELVDCMAEVLDLRPNVVFAQPRVGDIQHSRADNARLMALGPRTWTPLNSGLTALVGYVQRSHAFVA